MNAKRRFIVFTGFLALTLGALSACNHQPSQTEDISPDADTDRYHEKSFSWNTDADGLPKAANLKGSVLKQTRFENSEELVRAIGGLETKLVDPAFTDSLWKPVDYSCDELDLAFWNAYGTVSLGDSVVFNEGILKSRCRLTESAGEDSVADSARAKASGWKWWSESESSDRQYPYKMIGRSWDDFNLAVYKSTGGETQFEKNRSKYGVTAWYDTDATRIGVRIYLFDCGVDATGKLCVYNKAKTNWYKDDDYTSEREIAFGEIRISNTGISIKPVALKISDAVYSMHSVDHAGLQFRAISSSGIGPDTRIDALISPSYVTW